MQYSHSLTQGKLISVTEVWQVAGNSQVQNQRKSPERLTRGFYNSWRRAIFPGGLPPSIVAADRLYRRVRDGNGCVPVA